MLRKSNLRMAAEPQISIIVALPTGQCLLKHHHVIGLHNDPPRVDSCMEEEKTSYQIIFECEALDRRRRKC